MSKVFAIADLHLPGMSDDKSMDRFGSEWSNHFQKISEDWQSRVSPDDIVIIAGDISWAMKLEHAIDDLQSISALPGRKILIRGNHDFWWNSVSRIRALNLPNMYYIQNNSLELDDFIFAGSRGWNIVEDTQQNEYTSTNSSDKKIYERELARLELSLSDFKKTNKTKIGILHYPPLYINLKNTGFTKLFSKYEVQEVVYGHLHSESIKLGYNGIYDGVNYSLVSVDSIDFKIKQII